MPEPQKNFLYRLFFWASMSFSRFHPDLEANGRRKIATRTPDGRPNSDDFRTEKMRVTNPG